MVLSGPLFGKEPEMTLDSPFQWVPHSFAFGDARLYIDRSVDGRCIIS